MTNWRTKSGRWWSILRYHRTSQLVMRLVSMARRRLLRITKGTGYMRLADTAPDCRGNPAWPLLIKRRLEVRQANGHMRTTEDIAQGRYVFLNEERRLHCPVDWRLESWPEASHLWRFHLHYHEFLLDLIAQGRQTADATWFDQAWDLVADWIDHNRLDDARTLVDAWHPYCISRRLRVWILLWSASSQRPRQGDRILGSMYAQASFLRRHLEWDVGGNHLLENLRTLLLVGSFLDGPVAEDWLKTGEVLLRRQVGEQILPHGEHFERSPMYHALMLEALLDIREVVRPLLPDLAEFCSRTTASMAGFLEAIVHPDGRIPLLGDACLDEAPPARLLVQWSARGSVGEEAHV